MRKVKKAIKKVKIFFGRVFQRKTPVYVPVVYGDFLKGRTALITGGTSGIGYAVAQAYIKNGCGVIITGRTQKRISDAVTKLRQDCTDDEQLVMGFELDLTKTEEIASSFNRLLTELPGRQIDILVNNAGVMNGVAMGTTTIPDFEKTIKTNLEGTFFLSQAVCNYMIENNIKGNVLNMASSSSLRPAVSPYMLSKWGVRGLTEGMAKRFIPYGIVVNGIAPGPTATPMLMSSEGMSLNNKNVPAGRYCTSEEIANLAVVLVSGMGRMIVGDIIYITGGSGLITFDDMNY